MQDKAWGVAENLAPKQKMANEAYLDRLTNRTSLQSTEGFISVLIQQEFRIMVLIVESRFVGW